MTVHVHHLTGCSPTPLAHYLKALGILRLVSNQKDSAARGWWKEESFHLATRLDGNALSEFFLEDYEPTPLVAPWNGGSGFYPNDNKDGIAAITKNRSDRFAGYRKAIEMGRSATSLIKASPKNEAKSVFLRECHQRWSGPLLEWLEAAVVLDGDGEPVYPALLGTGGNDGRLDFTNNFMQRLAELVECEHPQAPSQPASLRLLDAALFRHPEAGLQRSAVGQFHPGSAGGANSSTGFGGDSLVNPWDFVLMLEGTLLFVASVARRTIAHASRQAAAPFAVRSSAAGFASASAADKNRDEQWMPLWERPATLGELTSLIAEGRSQIGTRLAARPIDFGRAIARLGVTRGIAAFERYGYIERNGQANLAVPLGRWRVQAQPHQDLIDEVAGWVEGLRRAGSDNYAPNSISRSARACEEAILACCRDGHNPSQWQALLIAVGAAEAQLPRSPRFAGSKGLRPVPTLSVAWLDAADDGSPEMRLALALASQHGTSEKQTIDWQDPIRRHFLPLEQGSLTRKARFHVRSEALALSPEVVCVGNTLDGVAIALMRRRMVEAARRVSPQLPLVAVRGAEAGTDDIAKFLAGRLNETAILDLARPLMALNWHELHTRHSQHTTTDALGSLSVYGLMRIAYWPRALQLAPGAEAVLVRLDPAIFSRLDAGDLSGAAALAIRRLIASGLRPRVRLAVGNPEQARRLAVALSFPIREKDATALARRLTRPADALKEHDSKLTNERKETVT